MDAQEIAEKMLADNPDYVRTIEDEIELQRQQKIAALKASGKKGTPVTEVTLRAWQERKRKRKEEEIKKLMEAESRKKKGGKGLSILSGRDLFHFKKELFVDDAAAENVEIGMLKGLEEDGDGEEDSIFDFAKSLKEAKAKGDEVVAAEEGVKKLGVANGLVANKELFLEGDDDDLDDLL